MSLQKRDNHLIRPTTDKRERQGKKKNNSQNDLDSPQLAPNSAPRQKLGRKCIIKTRIALEKKNSPLTYWWFAISWCSQDPAVMWLQDLENYYE